MTSICAQPAAEPWLDQLYPFQVEGARALTEGHAILLADDMGLGKTIQAIAALRALKARGQFQSALVVAPAGLTVPSTYVVCPSAIDLGEMVALMVADAASTGVETTHISATTTAASTAARIRIPHSRSSACPVPALVLVSVTPPSAC